MTITAQMHDGTRLEFPDGTDPAVIQRTVKSMLAKAQPAGPDPTEGMSTFEKLAAGTGKGMTDLAYGVGQRLGLVDQATIDEKRRLDEPLMRTGAGKVGNFTGNVALALPAAFIPGANGLAGAALVGGTMGAAQPTAVDESVTTNALAGAAGGVGGVVLGRALKAGYQGAKALVAPFTESGRADIAGRTIARFADDPSKITSATSTPTVTGALPTLAEQTGDRGLARLQDALIAADPQFNNQIGARLAGNNAARVNALQALGGDSTKRTAAEAARTAATKDLYTQATKANYTVDDALSELLQRPAMKQAMARANTLAANQGRAPVFTKGTEASAGPHIVDEAGNSLVNLGSEAKPGKITGQGLQDLKMAMDEMLTDPASGFTGKAGATIKDLRGKLLGWMESRNEAFKQARVGFREASKPINSMDVGDYVATKATTALKDLEGNPRMRANELASLLRDEPALIEKATGRKGVGNALSDIMAPQDEAILRAVANESDRAAAVAAAGNGPGSGTAQRMASRNILEQVLGPTGLPKSWADSVLGNTLVGKPFNLIYGGVAEPKIQQEIAQAILDPRKAADVLRRAQQANVEIPPTLLRKLTEAAGRALVPASVLMSRQR